MVRDALREGHMDIIAVGGDGTINEAVNGFFESGVRVSPDAVFSFVHNGHDSPLCRRLGVLPGWRAGVDRLAHARIHKRDIGRVTCLSAEGSPVIRFFLGGASFGLSGSAARAFGRARIAGLFGHGFATKLHRLLVRSRWRAPHVRLMSEARTRSLESPVSRYLPGRGCSICRFWTGWTALTEAEACAPPG